MNLIKLVKDIYKRSKIYLFTIFLFSVLSILVSIIFTLIPRLIPFDLKSSENKKHAILALSLAFFAIFILNLIISKLSGKLNILVIELRNNFSKSIFDTVNNTEYSLLENQDFINKKNKALAATSWQIMGNVFLSVPKIMVSIMILIFSFAMFFRLSPIIIPIILILSLVSFFLQNKYSKRILEEEKTQIVNSKYTKYYSALVEDNAINMESRVYLYKDFFLGKIKKNDGNILTKDKYIEKLISENVIIGDLFSAISLLIILIFLIYKSMNDSIYINDFFVYINAILLFVNNINVLYKEVLLNQKNNYLIKEYYDFINLVDTSTNTQDVSTKEKIKNPIDIEFRNLSFKYENKKEYALKNINLKFENNKTYSIVGENGSGKSTLIKLILRLYTPTIGGIYINNININDISQSDYNNLLGCIFQDFQLFLFSLKDNIAFSDYEKNRFDNIVEKLNIEDVINNLNEKENTSLSKIFDENGVELSGGQKQKIALARLLYKNPEIFILDEPTSALDSLSEALIYDDFNKIIPPNKIVIYISHKLISCTFSDEIIYMENGVIKEKGNHNELMDLEGSYYELFNLQKEKLGKI